MTNGSRLHSLEYLMFSIARWKLALLPESVAIRLGALVGWVAGCVLRVRRKHVDAHLTLAFPDRPRQWRDRVARASYVHLGREAVMVFRMVGWSKERVLERVTLRGFDEMHRVAESGEGAVLLTGHLGNWEVAGAAVAASGIELDVVGKGMANRRFQADLFAARERLGMNVIDMDEAPKGVLRSLGRGGFVAMLSDQNAHRSNIFLPFFGKEAATARGPALFAARKGVAVFFGFAVRDPGWAQRYTVTARRLDFRPTGDVEADTRALLQEYNRGLEKAVREAPGQYFWQHMRWKTRPPEEQRSSR